MKNKGISELYGRIMEDENIRNSLKIKAGNVKNDQDLKEFIKNEILPIAKKMQLNCTEDDILNYEKETMDKLSLDALGDVNGGISAKSLLMSGGIVSLVLLGAGFNSGTQSHAEVARTDVVSSTNELQKRLQPVTSAALTAGTPGEGSDAAEENTDQTETPSRQDMDSSAGGSTALEKEKELAETSMRSMPEANYSDPEYVVEGLNLIDPLIMKETGEVEGLRFMDGNTEKIKFNDENGNRMYNYDEGKGSSSYMRMLFPSVQGTLTLSVTATQSTSFANNCQPTPEVYAGIINYWHNAVRVNGVKPLESIGGITSQNFDDLLRKLQKSQKSRILNDLNKKIKEMDDLTSKIEENNSMNENEKKCMMDKLNSSKNRQKQLTLKLMMSYLPLEHFTKLAVEKEQISKEKIRVKKYAGLSTVLNLLNEGATMILNQEVNDVEKADKTRVLPKYTTEKMLLAHFLMYKNTKDEINKFYDCVSSGLEDKIKKTAGAPLNEALSTLTKRTEFVEKLKMAENSPYQAQTKENGRTYSVSLDDDKKITFNHSTFADCADTAVRHVVNLLCYNAEQKWTKLIKEDEEKNYRDDLKKVLEAIKTGGTVDNKSLKDKLKMFYLHQKDVGADEGNTETRSLWNYAICGIDGNAEKGLYK